MSFNAARLYDLLPAVLRNRDAERAEVTPGRLDAAQRARLIALLGVPSDELSEADRLVLARLTRASTTGPLGNLIALLAEPIGELQDDLDRLYDDQFIETCADWAASYIGELVGYQSLPGGVAALSTPRAEVAHTIGYRRRKGTQPVLEQLAFDVTRWRASAVEFFRRTVVSESVKHVRRGHATTAALRRGPRLPARSAAFDTTAHTIDVRRIASGRGTHNLRNVGLFLWRLGAQPLTQSPAVHVGDRRWRLHPLGVDQPLYSRARPLSPTEVATPDDVPAPIDRHALAARLPVFYTAADDITRSLRLHAGPPGALTPVPAASIRVCDLSNQGEGWAHMPGPGIFAVDPALGRVAAPADFGERSIVAADFHYGFGADLGGGEYDRGELPGSSGQTARVIRVPSAEAATIAQALLRLGGDGTIEIVDSGRYEEEALSVTVVEGGRIVIRAAPQRRPTIVLRDGMTLRGASDSEIVLDGLLISGSPLRVPGGDNGLRQLRVRHSTLVPGLALAPDASPRFPGAASLVAEASHLEIFIERSIVGGLRHVARGRIVATDSVIDATGRGAIALAGPDGTGPGATLTLDACTVVGKVHALSLPLVSNSIIVAALVPGDGWTAPVIAARRQEGCLRFSYVPTAARVPRRHRCLPDPDVPAQCTVLRFASLRYGTAEYGRLSRRTGAAVRTCADDDGEPGAFHFLHEPKREEHLRIRLHEYMRVGLEAGVFYES
jgi:hypothetical protein